MPEYKITEQVIEQAGETVKNLLRDNQAAIDTYYQTWDKFDTAIKLKFFKKPGKIVGIKIGTKKPINFIQQDLDIDVDPNKDSLFKVAK